MPTSAIRLYNTMTQRLEPLEPLEAGHIRVYVCGPTTYDHAHAGHARTFIAFDVLVRFLRACGLRVTYVRNVTDVDDKILHRAHERKESPLEFSRRMAKINADELHACGCAQPDFEPRVSESIDEIVHLIEELIARGAAYVAETAVGHDVYFAVRAFPAYGKLSHRIIDDLLSGARVEPGEAKRDPLDFALWKASGPEDWGWDSPWGRGRPGWHIECSAMAASLLSPHFDVHCGGMDLIFPHHENEIAQSEAAWGPPFAKLWMHSEFLKVDAEKMSKSLGNFVTIGQILERNDPEALRYFFLGAHYRAPVALDLEKKPDGRISFPAIDEAERRVEYLYTTHEALAAAGAGASDASSVSAPVETGDAATAKIFREAPARVLTALENDLNTSVALSVIGEVARSGNEIVKRLSKERNAAKTRELSAVAVTAIEALAACCGPLGLMQTSPPDFFVRTRDRRLRVRGLDAGWIEAKVRARIDARAAKDFARSDAIRAELAQAGVEVQDVAGAPATWRISL